MPATGGPDGAVKASFTTAAVFAATLIAAVPRCAGADAGPAGDPDAIFRAARKAWSFINYPRYATYTIVAAFRNGTTNVTRHYDVIADMRRNIVFARTFSREEIANPSLPHGFDVKVGSINYQGGIKTNAERNTDRIGPLALSVNYDFGVSLLPQTANVVSSGKDIEFPPNLPIIGTTGASTHDYTVRIIESLGGGTTYHLGLRPTHDAGRLRLREMWIDARTFRTERVLIAGNFNSGPYTAVPWLIEFNQIGGANYIRRETAEAPLDFDDDVTLPNVTIAFEELKLLTALPQYGAVGANDSSKAVAEP